MVEEYDKFKKLLKVELYEEAMDVLLRTPNIVKELYVRELSNFYQQYKEHGQDGSRLSILEGRLRAILIGNL